MRTSTVNTAKADLINALTTYAVNLDDIVNYVDTYDETHPDFSVAFGSGYDFDLNPDKWYLIILNMCTKEEITVDITDIVNKVK